MRLYLDRLPTHAGLSKLNAAVLGFSPHPATATVHFITPEDLHNNYPALPPWLRGCNTVGMTHPQILEILSKNNLMHLYKHEEVALMSVGEVLLLGGACRTKVLKIDVEGHDANLLLGYADFLWRNAGCWADQIVYESVNSNAVHLASAVAALFLTGYSPCGSLPDEGGGPPDDILCYAEKSDARIYAARARANAPLSEAALLATLEGTGMPVRDMPEADAIQGAIELTSHGSEGNCIWLQPSRV